MLNINHYNRDLSGKRNCIFSLKQYFHKTMSTHKKFAVVGPGDLGKIVINELLRLKAVGTISSVVVISRSVSQAREFSLLRC